MHQTNSFLLMLKGELTAAMKNVLSPSSDTMIIAKDVRNASTCAQSQPHQQTRLSENEHLKTRQDSEQYMHQYNQLSGRNVNTCGDP